MNLHQRGLLTELMKNEVFHEILAALAQDRRKTVLADMVGAHYRESPQAAAVFASELNTLENLPTLFENLLASQSE